MSIIDIKGKEYTKEELRDLRNHLLIIYYESSLTGSVKFDDKTRKQIKKLLNNLNAMAVAGGFYKALWGHDENIKFSKDLIEPLEKGLKEMKEKPDHFKQFNSKNGWGLYKNFVPWLEKLISACKEYPKANIYINR